MKSTVNWKYKSPVLIGGNTKHVVVSPTGRWHRPQPRIGSESLTIADRPKVHDVKGHTALVHSYGIGEFYGPSMYASGIPSEIAENRPSSETLINPGEERVSSIIEAILAEAREERFPTPSADVLSTAREIINRLLHIDNIVNLTDAAEIYPVQDGNVAIDVHGSPGDSVLILCEPDGGLLIMVDINDVHRYAHYDVAPRRDDGFLRNALYELYRAGLASS